MSSSIACDLVGIHPIVILTISDFYNRMKVTTKGKVTRVYGALMGQRIGSKVEIFSAFEFFNQSQDPSKINLDMQDIDTRRDLATQLFPKLDIVGFFSTNEVTEPNEIDFEVIKTMNYFGVLTPIFLILSTKVDDKKELPITVFECDKKTKQFKKLNHIMEGWESERICLETVTKTTDIRNDVSSNLIQNLTTMKNAFLVLKDNLKLIKDNMDKFEKDEKFMEMLEDLVINYPSIKESDYQEVLNEKEKEVLILNNICSTVLENSYLGKTQKLIDNVADI
jgi:hypothetical protein